HRLKDFWRKRQARPAATADSAVFRLIDQLADPHSDLSRQWDQEHDRHVICAGLDAIKEHFEPRTWLAFQRYVLEEKAPAEVAAELGLEENVVYVAKHRVLRRLRQVIDGLVDKP